MDGFVDESGNEYIRIDGDFTSIYNLKNMEGLINANDEISVILRGHLILEEFLNLWIEKNINYNIFDDGFFSFKTKLNISKKIGLPSDYFDALNSINTLRNKLSHRIGYQVQESELNVIKSKVDRIDIGDSLLNCEQITTTRVYHIGGSAESETRNWQSSDINNKLVIIFVILAIKLTTWIQKEFIYRNISYRIN